MLRFKISLDNLGSGPLAPQPVDPDEMVMDAQTYKDLEIFEGEGGASSLFDLLNHTRSVGGAKALRVRMKKPWSRPDRIRAVQDSISFILENRASFERILTDAVTGAVESYLTGSLPSLTSTSEFEFWNWVLEIRFGDWRPYSEISRGVQASCSLVRVLRKLAGAAELQRTPGELSALLDEVRDLLARPALAIVPPIERLDLPSWRILRLDRAFRLLERPTIQRLLDLACELDALVSMADAGERCGFVMPELVEGPLRVAAEGVYHPFIPDAVSNGIGLDQGRRMLFLTGPNMAGKTTYLRSSGIALYLAHLGMGVPARSFLFSPCERLFSSISVNDNVRAGVSYFRAEALRVKVVAQALIDGFRVVALMDEPFKGTNVKDALDASRAVLERFAEIEGTLFLVSSHLIELGEEMRGSGRVDLQHFEAGEQEGRLRFEYILRPGVSSQRLGMRVLKEEGIFDLINGAVQARGSSSS